VRFWQRFGGEGEEDGGLRDEYAVIAGSEDVLPYEGLMELIHETQAPDIRDPGQNTWYGIDVERVVDQVRVSQYYYSLLLY